MQPLVKLDPRTPTVEEYLTLTAAVGWKRREPQIIQQALTTSVVAICALVDHEIIGMGRLVSEGALVYTLADVVVRPDWQRRRVGMLIVKALHQFIESRQSPNIRIRVFPHDGSRGFYESLGYQPESSRSSAMIQWFPPRLDTNASIIRSQ